MPTKNKYLYKIATLIGFSTIALCILVFGTFRNDIILQTKDETEINDMPTSSEMINLALRDSIESYGMDLLGTPYVEAASSREGFDCSGFVYFVFQNFDILVPRSSSQFEDFGKEVSIENVKKGDVLVFLSPTRNAIGHVGIVTTANGMESEFIHASSSKEMEVIISSLKQEGYNRRFVKAVNVLANSGG